VGDSHVERTSQYPRPGQSSCDPDRASISLLRAFTQRVHALHALQEGPVVDKSPAWAQKTLADLERVGGCDNSQQPRRSLPLASSLADRIIVSRSERGPGGASKHHR